MVEVKVKRLSNSGRPDSLISERLIDVTRDYIVSILWNGQFRSYNRHEEQKIGLYYLYL